MSGLLKLMQWNACAHRLDLGLCSVVKESRVAWPVVMQDTGH